MLSPHPSSYRRRWSQHFHSDAFWKVPCTCTLICKPFRWSCFASVTYILVLLAKTVHWKYCFIFLGWMQCFVWPQTGSVWILFFGVLKFNAFWMDLKQNIVFSCSASKPKCNYLHSCKPTSKEAWLLLESQVHVEGISSCHELCIYGSAGPPTCYLDDCYSISAHSFQRGKLGLSYISIQMHAWID